MNCSTRSLSNPVDRLLHIVTVHSLDSPPALHIPYAWCQGTLSSTGSRRRLSPSIAETHSTVCWSLNGRMNAWLVTRPDPRSTRVPDVAAMSRHELTDRLKSEAIRLGFDAVGIAPAVAPPGYPRSSFAGSIPAMPREWTTCAGMRLAAAHPNRVLEGVRSVIMVSLVYGQDRGRCHSRNLASRGKVARYARGR